MRVHVRLRFGLLPICATLLLPGCGNPPQDSNLRSFPSDRLPPYITPLTEEGQRGDWSLDGRRVVYLTRAGGEAVEIDVETHEARPVTQHYERPDSMGYYRALYLANGDLLLTGGKSRRRAVLQILDASLTLPPQFFDEIVAEGPAVSRTRMRIAWTPEQDRIFVADLVEEDGVYHLADRRLVVDNDSVVADGVRFEGMIEPQNFRPPDERELIFSQYGTDDRGIFTAEVFGVDLETGALTNYSKAPNQYDEPEGIFPDGAYTLVECDRHHPQGTSFIEVYRLRLDGSGALERLTFFSDVEGYRASNPAVRDDGRLFVFQESRAGSEAGSGNGLYLFDLEKAGLLSLEQAPE